MRALNRSLILSTILVLGFGNACAIEKMGVLQREGVALDEVGPTRLDRKDPCLLCSPRFA
jgi:hypothetical protein